MVKVISMPISSFKVQWTVIGDHTECQKYCD